jgi:hypothetical protein
VDAALAQPPVHVEVVALLGPQHPGQCLPHHPLGVVTDRRRGDGLVELVRLLAAPPEEFAGVAERVRERGRRVAAQPDQDLGPPAAGDAEQGMGGRLSSLVGVHRIRLVEHVIGDAVLGKARPRLVSRAENAGRVGFVFAEEQPRLLFGVQVENAELVMFGAHDRIFRFDAGEQRLGLAVGPRPRVAEPQRGQHVDRRVVRGAVMHREAADDVFRTRFRVLDLDVEIVLPGEDAGVHQLVLEFVARAPAVDRD